MADMIIKPSSGNSLVLQDEGGDAALTVGTTGSTTLAGSANALGTVATGDISNTAIVYPVGHIIKTHTMTPIRFTSNTHTVALSGTNTAIVWPSATGTSGGTMQITGITATEGNLLWMSAYGGDPRGDADNTYETIVGFKIDSEMHAQIMGYQNTTYSIWNGHFGMVYSVPANFTNKTISLSARKEGGTASHYMQVRAARAPVTCWMIVQEIQQ